LPLGVGLGLEVANPEGDVTPFLGIDRSVPGGEDLGSLSLGSATVCGPALLQVARLGESGGSLSGGPARFYVRATVAPVGVPRQDA
jgi:hypothetical protein